MLLTCICYVVLVKLIVLHILCINSYSLAEILNGFISLVSALLPVVVYYYYCIPV